MPVSLASNSAGSAKGALVPIGRVSANALETTNPISFANIPQIYQDLMLVISARATQPDQLNTYAITLNSDYSALYSRTILGAEGVNVFTQKGTAEGYLYTNVARTGLYAPKGTFGSSQIHILNYANTYGFKTILTRTAADINSNGYTTLSFGLYRSTLGINRLDLFSNGGNWAFGSTATLYGVRSTGQ